MNPPPKDPDELLRPKRKWSVWTLLAPAALVVVVIPDRRRRQPRQEKHRHDRRLEQAPARRASRAARPAQTTQKASTTTNIYRVRPGDSIGAISSRFGLSEADLKTCNPHSLIDNYSLQPGMRLHINRAFCADRVKVEQARLDKLTGTTATPGTTSK